MPTPFFASPHNIGPFLQIESLETSRQFTLFATVFQLSHHNSTYNYNFVLHNAQYCPLIAMSPAIYSTLKIVAPVKQVQLRGVD
jgi:hypothetical protein